MPSIKKLNSSDLSPNMREAVRRIAECKQTESRELDLTALGLSKLPPELLSLTWLQKLYLSDNRLTKVPEWIGELRELQRLHLWGNRIREMPTSLARLTKLRQLIIDGGTASAANPVIGSLSNLGVLSLSDLGLTQVPEWIIRLKKLDHLYLLENRLSEIPEWIGELNRLKLLNISHNDLRRLPPSLLSLPRLKELYLGGNPHLDIPAELLKQNDPQRILNYYFRTVIAEAQPLNEFKLILVGRGGVGKTTLVHRLVTGKYKEFKRTPGINITKWPLEIDKDEVRAHIWDFGGQEIMHGTHRFFMTERALYLILVSGREGTEDHDAEYWLSLVRSFAGNVPMIVLLNKWDDYNFELNRKLLKEKYGRKLIFIETDSYTGTGMNELRERICQLARQLPGLKAAWPSEWRRIKEVLPQKKRSWLTFDDFRDFCSEQGITTPKDQEDLADSLHHLGLMLSYRKEEALRDFGVLNPQWVTKGIYQILNSPILRKSQGKFTVKTLEDVLPVRTYPKLVHPYLLALMRKFRLCHPLDDRGEKYLIPELLTKEEPELDAEFPPEKCLGFEYRYDTVLPEGLLPRFIVETYFLREPKYVWRTGAVLERANCRALVRGDVQGRTVVIRVAGVGNGQRELLGIIREHFERIHRIYEKLPVTELVPIPQHPETTVPYEELLSYEAAGDDEFKVVIGNVPRKFSVAELLDGVDIPGAMRAPQHLRSIDSGVWFMSDSLSVFISYSHKDELFRDELRGALTPYERKDELNVWDDTRIVAGQQWEPEILSKLETADIVILLLSNDFIRSDYCFLKEMERACERDKAGECAIVPVVVRACAFTKLELGELQAIVPNGKPVKQNRDRDAAWLEVTKQLDRVIANLKQSRRDRQLGRRA